MAIPDLKFDSGSVLTNQPALIELSYEEPPTEKADNGGEIGPEWDHNKVVKLTWHDDAAHGTIAELESARGTTRAHAITWNEPGGGSKTFNVDWKYPPGYTIVAGQVFGDIVITLHERPD